MASEDYMNLCGVIYDQLRQRIERVEGGKFGFVTRGTAAEVLHDENLKHLLRSLGSSRFPMEPQLSINEDVFVARIKERVLHDFLAILIFARCSIAATERFVTKFIAVDEWGLGLPATDKSALPAKHRTLKEIFENIPDADSFFANQAYFCALVLRKREEVRIESRDHQRPPYLDQSLLAEGAFGKVYRVRIAKGHFCDRSSEGFEYSTKTLEVARKDYIMSSEFPATSEREIMEKIFNSSAGTCKNIVENLGSLAIGKETYSLFMPLAICDLSAYMLHHYPVKPETTEAKADIIRCAVGLANGLKFLHTGMKTNDMDDLVCYHMDLKPSNVLIFRELDADGRPQFIWKLSDFGMARVKLRRRGQGADRVKDFNRFFKMRKKELNLISTMSKTVNRHGEGTYLAPESLSSSKSMGIGSDVWSLGCIISIVFAYLEDGSNGVIRYQDERSNHHTADGYDRFFVRAFVFRSLQVNPVVGGWHKQLIAKAMRRSIKEGEAVKGVLKNLEAAVFNIDPDSRCSAGRIMKTLQEAFKQYRSLQMEVPGSTPEQRRGSSAFAPSSESFWRIQKTR